MFSLRIVSVDHYMSSPKSGLDLTYSQFRGAPVKSVPVFRIFGSTPSGNKTCLHVHGVFPYILVPYSGEDDAGRLMYQLASSLDKAINVSQNTSHSTRQHVFKIVQVSGRPFYGYHSQDHQYFKIFFFNPLVVKRACDLLQNGAVCGTKFQIHEGHVPFTLQFFIDYNLYGMSFINLKSVVYRKDASPPGVPPGSLPKESCCELEADAVAVDILNRLTIEGELAVNPGLAAIWREEKERLNRDALEVSQRPEPPLAMSEMLLREKLADNLKFKGKLKTPLIENIPYPVETQRTTGSDILDASVLDTHSISSLALASRNAAEETTVIDEELVLSVTQSSILSNSLDQSLLVALDNLAAQNEMNAVISQNVEDDSILGSQMILEQDIFENDSCDGELEALNFSLPLDLPSENRSEDDNVEESDDSLEENIPQLDGIGDFDGKKNKSKQSTRKRRVLVENSATETYTPSDGEDILLNNIKDNNCWPESGKQETLEEIFSDEEPYNSPINNFEDSCGSVDLEPINVDLISSFETVLRGDPSFTSGDLASEDIMFQSIDDSEDIDQKESSLNDDESYKENQNTGDKKPLIDKNSNVDTVPSLNNSLDATDMDKSVMLAISGEELLSTSQLDEILNEDLNKGLEIICEKSPHQEFEDNWLRSGDTLQDFELKLDDSGCSSDEMLATNDEFFCSITGSEERMDEEIVNDIKGGSDENVKSEQLLSDIKVDELKINTFVNNAHLEENNPHINAMPSAFMTPTKKSNKNTSKKNPINKISSSRSPQKYSRSRLRIKFCNKNKNQPGFKSYHLYEMTRKEIETYYSQLENVTRYLSIRTDVDNPQPMLWFPIREEILIENLKQKGTKKSKTIALEKIMKKCKLSKKEILRMKSCKVKVQKLTIDEVYNLTGKPQAQFSSLNESRTPCDWDNLKENNLKNESLPSKNVSKHQKPLSSPTMCSKKDVSIKVKKVKQEKLSKPIVVKKSQSPTKSLPKLSVKMSELQLQKESPPKHKRIGARKSHCTKRSPSKLSDTPALQPQQVGSSCASAIISESCDIQSVTNKTLKNQKVSEKVKINRLQQKESKCVSKRLSFLGNEENVTGTEKVKNDNSTEENIKKDVISSCKNQEAASLKDQSTRFKLNKNCVIKLLPLSVDKANETHTKDSSVTKGVKRKVFSDNTCNNPVPSQKGLLDKVSMPEKLNVKIDKTPLVRVKKLVTSSGDNIVPPEKDIESLIKSKKQRLSNNNEYNSLNNKTLETNCARKRPLRIYSLDGTVDNSSSDENLDDNRSTSKPLETTDHCSTPNKRKKSKSCRSPRHYVPLSIEIKKSPKAKPKNEKKEMVRSVVKEKLTAEHENEGGATNVLRDSPCRDESDGLKDSEKRLSMDPLVSINRLPLMMNMHSDTSVTADMSQPTTSTSPHPLVKRLKVFVRRLSLDTQVAGDQLEHKRVANLRGRFHRSSSLPITSE